MGSRPEKALPFVVRRIQLAFGEFRALDGIELEVQAGEVHAILGEHGAGKSSLAGVMSGILRATAGEVCPGGRNDTSYNLKTAQTLGVRMVYQQPFLNENFSVGENLFYASQGNRKLGLYSRPRTEERAADYLRSYGFSIDPRIELRFLSQSDRVIIEILKNLHEAPCLLILDEALEKLSTESFHKIVPTLLQRAEEGMAIVMITHRIDDVYRLANRVSVLKEGTLLITDRVDKVDKLNLIRMAYTQVGASTGPVHLDTEFYQFLKYNEAILQSLPVNIIVVDEKLRIKMVNDHCLESFELAERPFINEPLDQLLEGNPDALSEITANIHRCERAALYNVTLHIRDRRRVNNVKTYPVFDGLQVIGTILIVEDITEYDELQKQFILSEKLASVGLLAAGVAHEINNPLEIISNYLSYLRYTHPEHQLHTILDRIRKELESISRIVSNLVTFSDRPQGSDEIVDLNDLVREIRELLRYNAEYKHIRVRCDFGAESVTFRGEEGPLKQVLLNLLKNSFEAMPGGGEIEVSTARIGEAGHEISRLTFADNGPGIDAPDPNNIFLPFFSTKSGRTQQLGLGLSISYRIIESLGGTIRAENFPGGGCRFTIDLPSADQAKGQVPPSYPPRPTPSP